MPTVPVLKPTEECCTKGAGPTHAPPLLHFLNHRHTDREITFMQTSHVVTRCFSSGSSDGCIRFTPSPSISSAARTFCAYSRN
jgi:hypothetical protein